ncbi:MAG: MurR/RpiR family transcriptional regulator [Ruminococcaceae bacterium]|nr:MurR/RpiR family transcriptional regulator [Oscillospiraceae bacterium]
MKRNLLKEIKERMPTFSKGQKLISVYILDNYDKAAYMTAAKLGAIVNVSESTVVRFAIELGFDGYPEFQHALQEIVRTKLTSFQRIEVTNNIIGDGDVLTKVLLADSDKIRHTLEEIDRVAFESAVEKIVNARRIYVVGVRSSSALASFLGHSLGQIFDEVKILEPTSGSEMFEQILNIGEEDVIIAISFPRYSKKIINAVDYAKHRGAGVIAITDSSMSPIAQGASQVLLARSDMASFVDSLVAPLSIINAIIVAVSRAKQDELTERLRKLEEIWDEYDVYDKNQG